MHRIDNTKFLLFIEPDKSLKSEEPVNDWITEGMAAAIAKAKTGTANYSSVGEEVDFEEGGCWRGIHSTSCGVGGGNREYLLENGMCTNYLAVFYLQYYRKAIPQSEMDKVLQAIK